MLQGRDAETGSPWKNSVPSGTVRRTESEFCSRGVVSLRLATL